MTRIFIFMYPVLMRTIALGVLALDDFYRFEKILSDVIRFNTPRRYAPSGLAAG